MHGSFTDSSFETWSLTMGRIHFAAECMHCSAKNLLSRLATHPTSPKNIDGYQKVKTIDEVQQGLVYSNDRWHGWVSPLSDLVNPKVSRMNGMQDLVRLGLAEKENLLLARHMNLMVLIGLAHKENPANEEAKSSWGQDEVMLRMGLHTFLPSNHTASSGKQLFRK